MVAAAVLLLCGSHDRWGILLISWCLTLLLAAQTKVSSSRGCRTPALTANRCCCQFWKYFFFEQNLNRKIKGHKLRKYLTSEWGVVGSKRPSIIQQRSQAVQGVAIRLGNWATGHMINWITGAVVLRCRRIGLERHCHALRVH